MDDWRIMGQKEYLSGKRFIFWNDRNLVSKQHHHCRYCWVATDNNNDNSMWYSTLDEGNWVCSNCYEDFHELDDLFLYKDGCFAKQDIISIIKNQVQFVYNDYYGVDDISAFLDHVNETFEPSTNIYIRLASIGLKVSPKGPKYQIKEWYQYNQRKPVVNEHILKLYINELDGYIKERKLNIEKNEVLCLEFTKYSDLNHSEGADQHWDYKPGKGVYTWIVFPDGSTSQ